MTRPITNSFNAVRELLHREPSTMSDTDLMQRGHAMAFDKSHTVRAPPDLGSQDTNSGFSLTRPRVSWLTQCLTADRDHQAEEISEYRAFANLDVAGHWHAGRDVKALRHIM